MCKCECVRFVCAGRCCDDVFRCWTGGYYYLRLWCEPGRGGVSSPPLTAQVKVRGAAGDHQCCYLYSTVPSRIVHTYLISLFPRLVCSFLKVIAVKSLVPQLLFPSYLGLMRRRIASGWVFISDTLLDGRMRPGLVCKWALCVALGGFRDGQTPSAACQPGPTSPRHDLPPPPAMCRYNELLHSSGTAAGSLLALFSEIE
ncbi:hypothetical protein GGR56DRAFT_597908 [Xylariaceae sp. FL0804]|nr:hypothetical protein GGR56DRAFT_597908 [Xylariaceae sp. FL0804]